MIYRPVVVGNVGDNSVSSYRLHASETQQLASAAPICQLCGVARGSRQPVTGRLATHPNNTAVNTEILYIACCSSVGWEDTRCCRFAASNKRSGVGLGRRDFCRSDNKFNPCTAQTLQAVDDEMRTLASQDWTIICVVFVPRGGWLWSMLLYTRSKNGLDSWLLLFTYCRCSLLIVADVEQIGRHVIRTRWHYACVCIVRKSWTNYCWSDCICCCLESRSLDTHIHTPV